MANSDNHSNDHKTSTMHLEEILDEGGDSTELSFWQALRKWPKVSAYCLALTTAILLWGYDMAMGGNLASLDQYDYGEFHDDEWIIQSKWQSAWNAGSPVGMIFGALLAGVIQDRLGRRISLGLGSVTSAAGVAIVYASAFASTVSARGGVFLLGKMIQGFTIGIVVASTQTYMSEVLPSVLRGPLIAFFPVFFLLGQLMSALIVMHTEEMPGRQAYLIPIISMWPFSAVPAMVAFVMPESPAHHIRKGRLDAALKAQQRLDTSKTDSSKNIQRLRASLEHEQRQAASDKSRYADAFLGTDRRRTVIACFGAILPQCFGLPILGDGPYFLQIAGMEDDNSLIFLVSGIVGAIAGTIISMWLLTFVGRRRLILVTVAPLVCLWLGMGIAGCFDSVVVAWYVGVTCNLVIFVAALGVWPASYVITAEVSSLRLRAKTQGVAWAFGAVANLFFSFVTPYIYNADAGNLRSRIGLVWAGLCLITTILCWYLVPEMLGRTPLQLDLLFEAGIPTRKFGKQTSDDLARIVSRPEQPGA